LILSVESGKEIINVPHRIEYVKWLKKLQKFDNTAVRKALNDIADLNEVIHRFGSLGTIGMERFINPLLCTRIRRCICSKILWTYFV